MKLLIVILTSFMFFGCIEEGTIVYDQDYSEAPENIGGSGSGNDRFPGDGAGSAGGTSHGSGDGSTGGSSDGNSSDGVGSTGTSGDGEGTPVGIPALVLLTAPEAQATVPVMEQIPDPGTQVVIQEAAQLVAQVLVMETVLMVVLVLVMVLEALEGHLMVLDQDQLVADPQMAMAVGMAQGMAQLVVQVLVTETVLTVGIPAPVLLMAPEALVMAQVTVPGTQVGKRAVVQLVAQVLVTETVLTVGIPAPVLLMASEALVTAVTVAQMMEQVTLVAAQVETAAMEAMAAELGLAEMAVRLS